MAKGAHWELVCSDVSRPFAIETFRLKVPNGWIYCNTITRARVFARDGFPIAVTRGNDEGHITERSLHHLDERLDEAQTRALFRTAAAQAYLTQERRLAKSRQGQAL